MTTSRKFTITAYTNETTDTTAWENWLSVCPVDHVVQSELFNETEALMEAATEVVIEPEVLDEQNEQAA